MEQIGRAAASRRSPDPAIIGSVIAAARWAPLAPQPFLVRGVGAQVAGDLDLAERAFREAEIRAPREPAPHYFLAQHYILTNRPELGLREIAVLANLVPQGIPSLAPFLADYAKTPGAVPHLKGLFRRQPAIGEAVLSTLASDAANADLVLALAEAQTGGAAPPWTPRLLEALVAANEFGRAQRIWSAVTGLSVGGGIFDPGFRGSSAPPPFNWSFATGAAGLAEPAAGGLHIIYYGRESAAMASQLLVLASGDYGLGMRIAGGGPGLGALRWSLTCLPSRARILDLPLDRGKDGVLAGSFRVPANGCAAQRLELAGTAPEVARQADVTITGLRLTRGTTG